MWCFICKSPQANANSLTKHLKLIHGLCSGKTLWLKCGQAGCSQVYGTFSGFRKHLNKAHEPCADPGEGPSTAGDLASSNFDLVKYNYTEGTVTLYWVKYNPILREL